MHVGIIYVHIIVTYNKIIQLPDGCFVTVIKANVEPVTTAKVN